MTRTESYTETENTIFEAALTVFSRKGRDGARMQEIAQEAGINQALLHYYFRSKEKLYETVFAHVFGEFMGAIQSAFDDQLPIDELLKTFIDRFLSIHAANPEISRLWILENLAGAPVLGGMVKERIRNFPDQVPNLFLTRLAAAVEKGELRRVDPFQTFVTLIGASVFFFLAFPTLSVVNPGLIGNRDEAIRERKKHLFDILYHGLAPSAIS